jgi:hypothetical protein
MAAKKIKVRAVFTQSITIEREFPATLTKDELDEEIRNTPLSIDEFESGEFVLDNWVEVSREDNAKKGKRK